VRTLRQPQLWLGLGAFLVTSAAALLEKWSLPEFCWSAWLAGLVYAWACVLSGAAGVLFRARRDRGAYEEFHPFFGRVSEGTFFGIVAAAVLLASAVALYVYSYLYGFYGLFLSVFAEMKSDPMFVRNGFINSDFVTPVAHLMRRFWPLAVGTLVVHGRELVTGKPWWRLLLPFLSNEILRIHLFTVALPFFTLLAWVVFQRDFQPVTVVLLLGLFFLVPKKAPPKEACEPGEARAV